MQYDNKPFFFEKTNLLNVMRKSQHFYYESVACQN